MRQRGQHELARRGRPGHCERGWNVPQHARLGHAAGLGLTGGHGAGWENPWGVLHHIRMDQSSPTFSPHLASDGGQATAPLGAVSTYQSLTFCPAHSGQGSNYQSREEATILPCWGTLWPSLGHHATPQQRVGEHCLDLTQSSQICALREPFPPAPCSPAR